MLLATASRHPCCERLNPQPCRVLQPVDPPSKPLQGSSRGLCLLLSGVACAEALQNHIPSGNLLHVNFTVHDKRKPVTTLCSFNLLHSYIPTY